MKKQIIKKLVVLIAVFVVCFVINESTRAADASSLTFTACQGGVMVSECNDSASGELVIPSTYNGQKVVKIGNNAFDNCKKLTKVVIPEGVTSIGESAFEGCVALANVEFPESLKTISDYAFFCCDALKKVQLYQNVTSIGAYAFYDCVNLKAVNIPNGIKAIEEGTFGECTSLEKIYIPESVTAMGDGAFFACNNLKEIYYCSSVYMWVTIDFGEDNETISNKTAENFGHDHNYSYVIITAPTCTEYGKGGYNCVCGDIYNGKVKPYGHTEALVKGYGPTCTLTGKTDGKMCLTCGVTTVEQIEIPATGHKEIVDEAVEATCVSTGLTRGSSCETCGEVFSVQTVIPKTEHPMKWIYEEDATCSREGLRTGYCTYCGENVVSSQPMKPHTYGDGERYCKDCDADRTLGCRCTCHKSGFLWETLWKMINAVNKFLKRKPYCACGVANY